MEGGRKIWNVLMADRLRRIRRFCLGFVSLEMRFHAVKSIRGGQSNVSVCVCVCFFTPSPPPSSIFFSFSLFLEKQGARQWPAGPDHDEFSNLRFIGDRLRANAKWKKQKRWTLWQVYNRGGVRRFVVDRWDTIDAFFLLSPLPLFLSPRWSEK